MREDIGLFRFDLDAPLPATAAGWLNPAERERAARFATATLRQRFTVGRAMLRRLLAEHTGEAPERLAIEDDTNGKPQLVGRPLAFNLSHAGNHALLAIGPARLDLGIDIEDLAAVGDVDALVTVCLSPAERQGFARFTDAATRRDSFLRLWVRKEACLKAIGQGLRIEPSEFTVGFPMFGADLPARIRGIDLRLSDLVPGVPGHAAAIAVVGSAPMPALAPIAHLAPASRNR